MFCRAVFYLIVKRSHAAWITTAWRYTPYSPWHGIQFLFRQAQSVLLEYLIYVCNWDMSMGLEDFGAPCRTSAPTPILVSAFYCLSLRLDLELATW